MKPNHLFFIVLFSFFTRPLFCQENHFNPWGIWNNYPLTQEDNKYQRIRNLSTGRFIEIGNGGLYIIENCTECVAGRYAGPAVAIIGMYNILEKYEVVDNSIILFLVGDGSKREGSRLIFKDNVHMKIQMFFVSQDECYFKYVSPTDENGYKLSFLPEENTKYYRYRVVKHEMSYPSN